MPRTDFFPTKDTLLYGNLPDNIFGADATIQCGSISAKSGNYSYHNLFEFDLSVPDLGDAIVQGGVIFGAVLTVQVTAVTGTTFTDGRISRLLVTDWTEAQATWNHKNKATATAWPGSAGANTDGADFTSTDQYTFTSPGVTGSFGVSDISVLAQDAIDNRSSILRLKMWRVNKTTTQTFTISTKEGTTTPYLLVNWAPPPGRFFMFF